MRLLSPPVSAWELCPQSLRMSRVTPSDSSDAYLCFWRKTPIRLEAGAVATLRLRPHIGPICFHPPSSSSSSLAIMSKKGAIKEWRAIIILIIVISLCTAFCLAQNAGGTTGGGGGGGGTTGGKAGRQTGRLRDRQTDRQTDRQAERQVDRQTDR